MVSNGVSPIGLCIVRTGIKNIIIYRYISISISISLSIYLYIDAYKAEDSLISERWS